MTIHKTPLENWIKGKIGLRPHERLTREALTDYQVNRLRETLDYVMGTQPFLSATVGRLFFGRDR